MAQLNPETATKVEAAEDGFKLLDPHIAKIQLIADVEVKQGAKGPYWEWQFQSDSEGPIGPGRKWKYRTSLSDAAFFKLKEIFHAFGVDTGTDTGELVGKWVRAEVIVKTIGAGDRMGELTNDIKSMMSLLDEDGKPGLIGKTGDAPKQSFIKAGGTGGAQGGSTEDPLF